MLAPNFFGVGSQEPHCQWCQLWSTLELLAEPSVIRPSRESKYHDCHLCLITLPPLCLFKPRLFPFWATLSLLPLCASSPVFQFLVDSDSMTLVGDLLDVCLLPACFCLPDSVWPQVLTCCLWNNWNKEPEFWYLRSVFLWNLDTHSWPALHNHKL